MPGIAVSQEVRNDAGEMETVMGIVAVETA